MIPNIIHPITAKDHLMAKHLASMSQHHHHHHDEL
jgi:hypothetical protein